MITWNAIKEVNRARRTGAPLGDIAVLKFAMMHTATPGQTARLRGLGDPCLEVDLAALRVLPDGTLGREYARQMDRAGLQPLAISPAIKQRFADDPYALRYTTTHDLFHVLTGFPTTPAGEIGLFGFMIGQGFGGGGRGRLWLGAVIYALMQPLDVREIVHNARLGLKLGRQAKDLIEAPLADYLDEPLATVRARLGLPDPVQAGIMPGRPSLVASVLLAKSSARAA